MPRAVKAKVFVQAREDVEHPFMRKPALRVIGGNVGTVYLAHEGEGVVKLLTVFLGLCKGIFHVGGKVRVSPPF